VILITIIFALIITFLAGTIAWNKWGALGGLSVGLVTVVLIWFVARWAGVFIVTGPDVRFQ
jgi:hypothetical protein